MPRPNSQISISGYHFRWRGFLKFKLWFQRISPKDVWLNFKWSLFGYDLVQDPIIKDKGSLVVSNQLVTWLLSLRMKWCHHKIRRLYVIKSFWTIYAIVSNISTFWQLWNHDRVLITVTLFYNKIRKNPRKKTRMRILPKQLILIWCVRKKT